MRPGEVEFLSVEDILTIHRDQISRYGGSQDVHDLGLLISAAAMPAATFARELLHPDINQMAAAYLFHLVQNHPFADGNKRVGAVAADVFLALNEIELTASQDDYTALVMSVARGESTKPLIAEFFRANTKPK